MAVGTARETRGRSAPAALGLTTGAALLAAASWLAIRGTEPFATWYYVFAWYATLLAADGLYRIGSGRFFLLGRPAFLVTLLAWSIPAWLFFELLNLRLRNWYYVFVPDHPVARWVGITVSFATVLPAILVAEACLARLGLGRGAEAPRLGVTPRLLGGIRIVGWLMLALPILWPRWFFPLAWGAAALLLEPGNYGRDASRSLIGDLERGQPGRVLRLLVGGLLVGLLWEAYNAVGRGGWIYTVPFLEELKLFEMPPLGFLGFPVFALECFAIWQALVLGGVAVPREGATRAGSFGGRAGAVLAGLVFSAAVLLCMEARTISSVTPRLTDLGVPAARLERAGFDAFSLGEAAPGEVAARSGLSSEEAERAIERARLATLRGIGAANAAALRRIGISSVSALAEADPAELARALRREGVETIVPARVRVWVRAARAAS